MTVEELKKLCLDCIAKKTGIQLVMPKKTRPPGWPRGRLIAEIDKNHNLYYFEPIKILTLIQKAEEKGSPDGDN